MSIVKFEKGGSVHKCKLKRCSNNIMEIILNENIDASVLISGFVTLNENNFSVQGIYKDFSTIYQSYDDSDKHYKLSNDGSVYAAPEPVVEPEPTPEELEIQKQQEKIYEINVQINSLKDQLTSTDYKILKEYEYSLVNKESEYNMDDLHNERQTLRDQINNLEEELQNLLQ